MRSDETAYPRFLFPRWANYLLPALVILAIGVLTYVPLVLGLGLAPETTNVGYTPEQPLPFSHALHAGELKMDCRYCHTTVETAAFAAIPSTKICMNCHASIKSDSDQLQLVRNSYQTGEPVSWKKVHHTPDFVYFNHSIHLSKGVGCAVCHGRVDQMDVVSQDQPMSMAWCLRCHRDPAPFLRPREELTNMQWEAETALGLSGRQVGEQLLQIYDIQPAEFMTSCTTCHR